MWHKGGVLGGIQRGNQANNLGHCSRGLGELFMHAVPVKRPIVFHAGKQWFEWHPARVQAAALKADISGRPRFSPYSWST